jgi:hypothetical protein
MRTKTGTQYNAGCGDDPAPGGIPRTRLAWLCQPEHVEHTLRLLYSLNHWARARERLLYADRQGLYRVKAALVRQAFAAGLIGPVSYSDGTGGFARDLSLDGFYTTCKVGRETAANTVSSSGGPSPRQRAGSIRLETSCANWEPTSLPFAPTGSLRNRNISRGWRGDTPPGMATGMTMTRKRAGMMKPGRS